MEVLLKSVVLVAGLLLGVVPAIAWMERRQQIGAAGGDYGFIDGALRELDSALRVLARPGRPPAASRRLHQATPRFAVLVALTGFAWIPFAGASGRGGFAFEGVAAESEVGALWVAGLLMLACFVPALAGLASRDVPETRTGLGASGLAASLQLPFVLSILSLGMIFGSLSLGEIVDAQDRGVPLAWILEAGFGPTEARMPAWGLFFQPLGFVVFFIAGLVSIPAGAITGPQSARDAARPGTYRLAAAVHLALIAALAVTLFFGGFAVPGLPSATLVGALDGWVGAQAAVAVCATLQVVGFVVKLLFMCWLLLAARAVLPEIDAARWMRLCWLRLLPLALFNLVATAWFVAAWTGA